MKKEVLVQLNKVQISSYKDMLDFLMKTFGCSQAELAMDMGISSSTMNNWCRGISVPSTGKSQNAIRDYLVNIPSLYEQYTLSSFDITSNKSNKELLYDISEFLCHKFDNLCDEISDAWSSSHCTSERAPALSDATDEQLKNEELYRSINLDIINEIISSDQTTVCIDPELKYYNSVKNIDDIASVYSISLTSNSDIVYNPLYCARSIGSVANIVHNIPIEKHFPKYMNNEELQVVHDDVYSLFYELVEIVISCADTLHLSLDLQGVHNLCTRLIGDNTRISTLQEIIKVGYIQSLSGFRIRKIATKGINHLKLCLNIITDALEPLIIPPCEARKTGNIFQFIQRHPGAKIFINCDYAIDGNNSIMAKIFLSQCHWEMKYVDFNLYVLKTESVYDAHFLSGITSHERKGYANLLFHDKDKINSLFAGYPYDIPEKAIMGLLDRIKKFNNKTTLYRIKPNTAPKTSDVFSYSYHLGDYYNVKEYNFEYKAPIFRRWNVVSSLEGEVVYSFDYVNKPSGKVFDMLLKHFLKASSRPMTKDEMKEATDARYHLLTYRDKLERESVMEIAQKWDIEGMVYKSLYRNSCEEYDLRNLLSATIRLSYTPNDRYRLKLLLDYILEFSNEVWISKSHPDFDYLGENLSGFFDIPYHASIYDGFDADRDDEDFDEIIMDEYNEDEDEFDWVTEDEDKEDSKSLSNRVYNWRDREVEKLLFNQALKQSRELAKIYINDAKTDVVSLYSFVNIIRNSWDYIYSSEIASTRLLESLVLLLPYEINLRISTPALLSLIDTLGQFVYETRNNLDVGR